MKKAKQIHKKNQPQLNSDQIWNFLEDYSAMIHGRDQKTVMISLRIPKNVLESFKVKAKLKDVRYQSQIVKLMRDWLQAT